jgi:ABC-type polysaccharide/polyol phosphate transport system ATPase subunit
MMADVSIVFHDVHLTIPVFLPGQQRLLRRPSFLTSVGAPFGESRGKIHVKALNGISFAMGHGQHLGVIGHNGAGKSTLLRVIAGIYPPTAGSTDVRGSIGCLFEAGVGAMPEMTGREMIKRFILIRRGLDEGWTEIAEEVGEFTELGDYLDLPIRTYSTGMHSRLTAALATAWPQDILLMDEGIGAGDAAFHQKFATRLRDYMSAAHLLVLASHNNALLSNYCTHGLVLMKGKNVFFGCIDDAIAFYKKGME